MKQILYTLLSLFLLISCQQEDILSKQGKGYLQLENLALTLPSLENIKTRALDEGMYIKIIGNDLDTIFTPDMFPLEKIVLPAGTYKLEAYNEAYNSQTSNEAKYYTQTDFTIEENKVRYITLKVPMINVGIQLAAFTNGLENIFSNPKLTITTSTGEEGVSYIVESGQTAYVDYKEGMTFTYALTATNTDNETFTTEETTYGNEADKQIESGHCYVISYSLETKTMLRSQIKP